MDSGTVAFASSCAVQRALRRAQNLPLCYLLVEDHPRRVTASLICQVELVISSLRVSVIHKPPSLT